VLSFPLLRWLWVGAGVLVVGHVVTLVAEIQYGVSRAYSAPRQFDLNGEANLAAWYQSFLLLLCALATLALASHFRGQEAPLSHRWIALSGLFALMAIDESAQLHDMFTGPLRRGLAIDFGVFYFAWLLPAVAFLAACAWYFAPIVLSLPAAVYRRLIAAVGVFLTGAVVVEMASGFAVEHGRKSTPYLTVLTIEEACEIAGGLLLVGALFTLLRMVQPRTLLELSASGGTVGIGPAAVVPSESRGERLP